jgi:hypothetical protein
MLFGLRRGAGGVAAATAWGASAGVGVGPTGVAAENDGLRDKMLGAPAPGTGE